MRIVQPSEVAMAKRSAAKTGKDGSVPLFHATTAYKQWIREQLEKRKWSLPRFASELKRAGATISVQGIHDVLGPKDEVPEPSNIWWMPAANDVLGIAAPNICNPHDPMSQLRDQFSSRWLNLTKRERNMVLTAFGLEPEK